MDFLWIVGVLGAAPAPAGDPEAVAAGRATSAEGAAARVRIHRGPAVDFGHGAGHRQADGAVRGAQRPPVPHESDEPRDAQLPVRLSAAPALAVPVLYASARTVHSRPHPAQGSPASALPRVL